MANLKRNMIELVLEVKEGEIVTKKYVTPVFIPLSVVYEAIDLMAELNSRKSGQAEKDMIDKVLIFVAEKVYNKIVTKAKDLVAVGDEIAAELGIPIVNKRVSVTPISIIGAATNATDYVPFAKALDRAAKEVRRRARVLL